MKSVQQYNDSLNEGKTLDAKKFNKLKSDSDRVKYLKDIYGGEINGEDFYSPDEEPEKVKANKTLDKMIDSGILSVEDEDEFIYGFNESKLDEGINITPKNFIKDIKVGAGWISDYMLLDKFQELSLSNDEKRAIAVELARKGMLYSENDIEEDNDGFELPEKGQMEVKAAKKLIDDMSIDESVNEGEKRLPVELKKYFKKHSKEIMGIIEDDIFMSIADAIEIHKTGKLPKDKQKEVDDWNKKQKTNESVNEAKDVLLSIEETPTNPDEPEFKSFLKKNNIKEVGGKSDKVEFVGTFDSLVTLLKDYFSYEDSDIQDRMGEFKIK